MMNAISARQKKVHFITLRACEYTLLLDLAWDVVEREKL